jgi:hypothetical protein
MFRFFGGWVWSEGKKKGRHGQIVSDLHGHPLVQIISQVTTLVITKLVLACYFFFSIPCWVGYENKNPLVINFIVKVVPSIIKLLSYFWIITFGYAYGLVIKYSP